MFRQRGNIKIENCKRGTCVYIELWQSIELIEIAIAIVFKINRHWVMRIIKKSLYGVTLCKIRV